MRLLDLFCGAGGATKGYQRAGFHVTGVDIKPQPNYCGDAFVQADALEYVACFWPQFHVIHASPPCQAFTQMSARWRGKGTKADTHPNLLPATREPMVASGLPYVIENVLGAKHYMRTDLLLHGGMFGLGVNRPRRFETNVLLLSAPASSTPFPIGVYGTKPDGITTYRYRNNGNYKGKSLIRAAKSVEEASAVMGIDWMTWEEIREAIPPAYTEYIGRQLIQILEQAA